jgi:hypothetical protein
MVRGKKTETTKTSAIEGKEQRKERSARKNKMRRRKWIKTKEKTKR